MSKFLDDYTEFSNIKKMSYEDLDILAQDIREFLIDKVSKTGGHLASNLGVVELTLSLYNVFNLDKDKIIWDVGHQSYVHKILTGRKDQFETLRSFGGLSGFPKRVESKFDFFETGHSSTSISAALGMARARDLKKDDNDVVAVIGDGALTGGMALEALNDLGFNKTKMIVILNDNQMSISNNVGGMSSYLSKLRVDPKYNKLKNELNATLRKIPNLGKGMANSIHRLKDGIKQLVVPGMFFEEIGIKYFGPIDGHNIKELTKVLSMARKIDDPVLIHVVTQKGKGYKFAETNPKKFHGIGPFNCNSGEVCVTSDITYSKAFGDAMVDLAKENKSLVGITAAMPDGTGLKEFAKTFEDRFFDVGIAEQHAVTLAGGMASQGLKPVFAVYSTFLQRAYDQVLHDICIQNLPVIFAIDRAGIVGKDGETHQGVFDLSYLSHLPNMTIMAPKCVSELKPMLSWALNQNYPIAIRYPRGGDNLNVSLSPLGSFKKGKWEVISQGKNIAIIATGKMVQIAMLVRDKLLSSGLNPSVVNATFVKPIDKDLIENLVANNYDLVTLEDNVINGGLGSLVLQYVNNNLSNSINIMNIGFKDEFIPHGSSDILYKLYGLDVDSIANRILENN